NLRLSDPSLTGWERLASVFTMLYVVYSAPDTRIAFAAFVFVARMFGMLRHSGTKLAVLGFISLLSYALVIAFRFSNDGDAEMLRIDTLQLVVMGVALPWFVFIGDPLKRLRTRLNQAPVKLEGIEEKGRHD